MKTFAFSLLVLAFSLPHLLQAQGKQIDAGIKSYENGRYETAIASLDAGLENPDNLKDKVRAKGHYHRAAAQITFLRRMTSWENLPKAMAEKVQRYALTAASDLVAVRKYDSDKKFASQMKNWERKSQKVLTGLGELSIFESNKAGVTETDRTAHLEAVIAYANAAILLDKFNYAPYNMKGDAALALGDSADALKYFRLADDQFFRSAPKSGDLTIAYTYMNIAILEKAVNGDMAAAEKALAKGQEQLNGEHKKIQVLGNRRPDEKASLDRQYQDINEELAKVAAKVRGSE